MSDTEIAFVFDKHRGLIETRVPRTDGGASVTVLGTLSASVLQGSGSGGGSSDSSGTWTPNLVASSGAAPTISEQYYSVNSGMVTATLAFTINALAGQSATDLRFTNLPLWDRALNVQYPIVTAVNIIDGSAISVYGGTPIGINGSKTAVLNVQELQVGTFAYVSAMYVYPAAT